MSRIRLALRRRRRAAKGDRGAGAVEYLGAILLVSLVIGSLLMVATPVGNTIAAKLCEAVGTTCGATSDADTDGILTQKAEPEYACVVSNEGTQISGNLQILFVTLDSGGELLIEELSDGTHRVTVSGETGVGISATPGELSGQVAIGEYDVGMDVGASGEAGVFAGAGQEYSFDNLEDAEEFSDWVVEKTSDAALTAVAPPIGWAWSGIKWVKNKITGNEYTPPAADATYFEGGAQVNGSVAADVLVGGGSFSARAENALGVKIDHKTGDKTVYSRVELSAEARVQLGLSTSDPASGVGASGSGNVEFVVEMTFDSNGEIANVGLDGAATVEGAQNLTALVGKPLPGGGKGVQTSASFDVTDQNRDEVHQALRSLGAVAVADAALPGASLTQAAAIPLILAEANKSGDISATLVDVDSQNLVAIAAAGKAPGIGGIAAGVEATRSSSETTDAYYFGDNKWNKWSGCVQ